MADAALAGTGLAPTRPSGWRGIAADWSSDQRAFKNVSWGKAMMWIFLLSETFILSCFLLSYMTVRSSTTVPWPNPSEVFALTIGGTPIPLILIAIMTFILISSSGTMAMAVNFGYRHDRVKSAALMLVTAAFGATFVGMQGFEWTKLIMEGVRPWGNPWGADQFGSSFFMITGFHGTHVTIGVIFLIIISRKVLRGDFDREARGFFTSRKGHYEIVEIMGLYWLLSRRLLRSPWIPQMVSHPPVYDFEGRLDCRGLYAYGLGAAGPAVRHSGTASVGVGVCRHHGVRIDLHAFHSDHIFWGGALDTKSIAASEDQAKSSVGVDATLPPAQAVKVV